jgi:hypothetical protein
MWIVAIINNKIVPIEKVSITNSIWFWISVIELTIILVLLFKSKSKRAVSELSDLDSKNIKGAKNNSIDMDNLLNSIHNSKRLYRELSKKCHPDRFINDPKQLTAQEIFQEITLNEKNFEKLSLLKVRAENELNITF